MRAPGWQARLCTDQRLHLALFVAAQHHRTLRRAHLQPNDVGQLFFESDVIGDFESLAQMRLGAVRAPDRRDRGRAGTGLFDHGARAPVGGRLKLCSRGQFDDPMRALLAKSPATRGIFLQPVEFKIDAAGHPEAHPGYTRIKVLRNHAVGKTCGGHRPHIGSHHTANICQTRSTPAKQGLQIIFTKLHPPLRPLILSPLKIEIINFDGIFT